jgi:hypothetical protein
MQFLFSFEPATAVVPGEQVDGHLGCYGSFSLSSACSPKKLSKRKETKYHIPRELPEFVL